MKLQFLLAGIVATGLFASAPDAVAHGGLGEGAAEAVTAAARSTVAAGFMAGAGFTAGEAFTAGVVSGTFAAGISRTFAAGVLGSFTAIVSFFNSLPGLFIGIPTILTITPIWTTDRITTFSIGIIRPRLCNRNPSIAPAILGRL